MADRPIIFSAPMVRALLDGRKSQTRRILGTRTSPRRVNIFDGTWSDSYVLDPGNAEWRERYLPCARGDRLYVREQCATWGRGPEREPVEFPVAYAADDPEWDQIRYDARNSKNDEWKIRPSIHMPRWASRLTLIVTDVRVQRLQEISEADAVAEGIEGDGYGAWLCYASGPKNQTHWADPRASYRTLWNSLHGPDAWDANPWVAAISFTANRGNIDQM